MPTLSSVPVSGVDLRDLARPWIRRVYRCWPGCIRLEVLLPHERQHADGHKRGHGRDEGERGRDARGVRQVVPAETDAAALFAVALVRHDDGPRGARIGFDRQTLDDRGVRCGFLRIGGWRCTPVRLRLAIVGYCATFVDSSSGSHAVNGVQPLRAARVAPIFARRFFTCESMVRS